MSEKHPPSNVMSDEKYDGKVTGSVEQVEESITKAIDDDDDSALLLPGARQHAERKLVRKLDFRLLPTIVLVFILNYIDVGLFLPVASSC